MVKITTGIATSPIPKRPVPTHGVAHAISILRRKANGMNSRKLRLTSPAISNYFAMRAMNSYEHNAGRISSNGNSEPCTPILTFRTAKLFCLALE